MGKLNASTLASTPAPAAPATPPQKAAAPAAPPAKKAAPAPAKTEPKAASAQAPVAPAAPAAPATPPAAPTGIVRMGLTFGPLPGPAAEPPPGPAAAPPIGFYSTRMREVEALRAQRALGPKETPLPMVPGYRSATAFGGTVPPSGSVTLPAAGDYSLKVESRPGLSRTFSARPSPEAMTVTTSSQEEFVRRGERLGKRYASLRRTLMDLADTRRELESLKKAGAEPVAEAAQYGATTDERLKSIARRTQSANRDMAQTLADLREFGIDEREAEEQYGSQ